MQSPPRPVPSVPAEIRCARDYEEHAARVMSAAAYAYVAGGSGDDITAGANTAAFRRWAIHPRLLRDVTAGHTRLELAGRLHLHPVMLAPVAFQKLAHPQGEIATARGAEASDTCMVASTLSTVTLEAIAQAGASDKWFQLYLQPDPESTRALVRRAVAAGYRNIVVTLDAPVQSMGLAAQRAGFQLPADCVAANLPGETRSKPVEVEPGESRILQGTMRDAPKWSDIDWLLKEAGVPVWAKGVMHPEDALALKARGIAGLVVSNHGGRGLDRAPSSLAALPAIRAAVGDAYPVLLDGGIRSGTDAFIAIALGANAVQVGRLQVYALAVAGALGVAHMLRLLREELELCMALAGCATLRDIGPAALTRAGDSPETRTC